jgi:type IV pilus assembly protein PilA
MMKHRRSRGDRNDRSVIEQGFTLIELLVVIAILGVLAVVGILSFTGLTGTAKTATAKTEITQVQAAVDAYNAKHPAANMANATPLVFTVAGGLEADGELKTGSTYQCAYDLTNGNVTFDANQAVNSSCPTSGT